MRRILSILALPAAAIAVAGCFNPFRPDILPARVATVAPRPTTAQNAVKLFEWCWVNRGVNEYRTLFTDDYVFISAGTDSAGNPSREIQARRNDEVTIAENMFIGSSDRPPAASITLQFDRNLVSFPDTRPGKNARWHRQIRTSVDLRVKIDDGNSVEVTGNALFFLTRGDSAAIPRDTGLQPDSLRWWIDRWEDETLAGAGGLQALRAGRAGSKPLAATGAPVQLTMGEFKRIYAPRLPARSQP